MPTIADNFKLSQDNAALRPNLSDAQVAAASTLADHLRDIKAACDAALYECRTDELAACKGWLLADIERAVADAKAVQLAAIFK